MVALRFCGGVWSDVVMWWTWGDDGLAAGVRAWVLFAVGAVCLWRARWTWWFDDGIVGGVVVEGFLASGGEVGGDAGCRVGGDAGCRGGGDGWAR